MLVCTRRQKNGTSSIDQPLSIASHNTCHALSARAAPHLPPPVPPFLLAQNLSSEWIAPTDNMRLNFDDNYSCHSQLIRQASYHLLQVQQLIVIMTLSQKPQLGKKKYNTNFLAFSQRVNQSWVAEKEHLWSISWFRNFIDFALVDKYIACRWTITLSCMTLSNTLLMINNTIVLFDGSSLIDHLA